MTQPKPTPRAPRRKARAKSPRVLELETKVALQNMEKRRRFDKADRAKMLRALGEAEILPAVSPVGKTIDDDGPDEGKAETESKDGNQPTHKDLMRQLDTYDGRFVLMMLFGNLPQISDDVREELGLPPRQRNGKPVAMTSRSVGRALSRDAKIGPDGGPSAGVAPEKLISEGGYNMRVDRQIEILRRCGLVEDDPDIARKDNLKPLRGTDRLFNLCLEWFGKSRRGD